MHVVTGPDHLSAIATLSANVGSVLRAFGLGVRWGLGHSTGLLLVGTILILATRGNGHDTVDMPDLVSHLLESLVGVFMIFLGIYGLRRAVEKRRRKVGSGDDDVVPSTTVPLKDGAPGPDDDVDAAPDSSGPVSPCHHDDAKRRQLEASARGGSDADDIEATLPDAELDGREYTPIQPSDGDVLEAADAGGKEAEGDEGNLRGVARSAKEGEEKEAVEDASSTRRCGNCCRTSNISTRTMAIWVGIVHGLAGPGGVLGVIPAVQLHDGRLAAIYLASFCLCSTLTMGAFASVYGTCSARLVDAAGADPLLPDAGAAGFSAATLRREYRIECASAMLSIVVGVLWLVLLAIGKLDAVFP